MAKQGQHKNDDNDPRVSKGPNNPDKSVTITTGSVKKQGSRHPDSDQPAQQDKNEWRADTREEPTRDSTRRTDRSGSASNTDAGTRGH